MCFLLFFSPFLVCALNAASAAAAACSHSLAAAQTPFFSPSLFKNAGSGRLVLPHTHSNTIPTRLLLFCIWLAPHASPTDRLQPSFRCNRACDRIYWRCNSPAPFCFCERQREGGRGCCFVRLHNMASDAYKDHMASLVHARAHAVCHFAWSFSFPSQWSTPPLQLPHLPRQCRIRTAAAVYFKKLVFY